VIAKVEKAQYTMPRVEKPIAKISKGEDPLCEKTVWQ
jgi:hypothetical protein